jgi:hypothetical protein
VSEKELRLTIGVESASSDPYQARQMALGLRQQLSKSGLDQAIPAETGDVAAEKRDPLIIGAVVIAVAPTVVTKVFEIIQAYVSRHKGLTVKLKIQQTADEKTVEVEIPYTASPSEVTSWVNAVRLGLPDKT